MKLIKGLNFIFMLAVGFGQTLAYAQNEKIILKFVSAPKSLMDRFNGGDLIEVELNSDIEGDLALNFNSESNFYTTTNDNFSNILKKARLIQTSLGGESDFILRDIVVSKSTNTTDSEKPEVQVMPLLTSLKDIDGNELRADYINLVAFYERQRTPDDWSWSSLTRKGAKGVAITAGSWLLWNFYVPAAASYGARAIYSYYAIPAAPILAENAGMFASAVYGGKKVFHAAKMVLVHIPAMEHIGAQALNAAKGIAPYVSSGLGFMGSQTQFSDWLPSFLKPSKESKSLHEESKSWLKDLFEGEDLPSPRSESSISTDSTGMSASASTPSTPRNEVLNSNDP